MWVWLVFDEYGQGSIVFDEPDRDNLEWKVSYDSGVDNGQRVWLDVSKIERV